MDEDLCSFFRQNSVIVIISIKDNSEKTYNRILYLYRQNIRIELYHVLTKSSTAILKDFCLMYYWVNKVRLLHETSSDPLKEVISPEDWFLLLRFASYYLKPILDKVEVEIGYLPKNHPFIKKHGVGAVKRILLDYNGKLYPCPLIVEKEDGVENAALISGCDVKKCPVIKKSFVSQEYAQVCPFIITKLRDFNL